MKFATVLADPPWQFEDRLDKTRRLKYPVLSTEDILKLPVSKIVADKAHLYLWVTHSHLREGLDIVKAWGFEYKTFLTWVKKTKTGKPWFGMGRYFRESREICLFGVRGGLKTLTHNTRDTFEAPVMGHSVKPEIIYEIIEANSPPPRIELFARRKRPGWVSLGYDIDGRDIRESIMDFIEP